LKEKECVGETRQQQYADLPFNRLEDDVPGAFDLFGKA